MCNTALILPFESLCLAVIIYNWPWPLVIDQGKNTHTWFTIPRISASSFVSIWPWNDLGGVVYEYKSQDMKKKYQTTHSTSQERLTFCDLWSSSFIWRAVICSCSLSWESLNLNQNVRFSEKNNNFERKIPDLLSFSPQFASFALSAALPCSLTLYYIVAILRLKWWKPRWL